MSLLLDSSPDIMSFNCRYQVLFNHVPNNDDELELIQGETVLVLEKCGDGWYIGSKTSGGKLGIFPGTHVRRIAPEFV